MSEDFKSQDYSEYFSQIERSLKRETQNEKSSAYVKPVKIKRKRRKIKPVFKFAFFAVVFVTSLTVVLIAAAPRKDKNIIKPDNEKKISNEVKNEPKRKIIKTEYDSNTVTLGDDVNSKNVMVINTKTNKAVAVKNPKEKCYPASTTKILTLLTAVENITDFNDTFTMTYEITDPLYKAEATVAGFLSGEVINMTDLLYGTVLPSGGDAAMGLACKISGSEAEFVKLMNKKVKELGLKNTHFTNVTGLFDANHYTTAEDMSVILRTAMDNELCRKILSTYQYTAAKTPQHPDGLQLTSTLFSYMYGTEPEGADILGGKTGYVGESGYCIASFGNSDSGNEYVCVTMCAQTRWPAVYDQINIYSAYAK